MRDILLRPGLNIIWSPSAESVGDYMGHGGGKTSFCRLVRYCLGEESFGTEIQRQRIASAMPEAHVGAEVMLDGELWTVLRPIGAGAGSSSHCAQEGGSLEALVQGEIPNPTMRPLRQAIASAVMPSVSAQMPGSSSDDAWQAALAWMTRDQECRLRDVLDWRAPETQSHSPVRNMSESDRLKVVRLLLKALHQDEIHAVRRAQAHRRKAQDLTRRKQSIEWLRDNVARDLRDVFGNEADGKEAPDFWSRRAKSSASAAKLKSDPKINQKLLNAQEAVADAERELRQIEDRLTAIDAVLSEIDQTIQSMDVKVPKAALDVEDAADPRCPTCKQRVTPESEAHIESLRLLLEGVREDRSKAQSRQVCLIAEQKVAMQEAARVGKQLEAAKKLLVTIEQNAKDANDALASATGYVTLTTRYPTYTIDIEKLETDRRSEVEAEAAENHAAEASRRAAQTIVQRLSELFDMTIRYLVPEGAHGEVRLNESGIEPVVGLHGDLTTAAVDSLKIVAFDLAALLLTIEGNADLPGFWLHDSPREADLELAIYHRIFELALWLEQKASVPQFQYLITTTTRPPEHLKADPRVVLTLRSAPAEQRLFCRDL